MAQLIRAPILALILATSLQGAVGEKPALRFRPDIRGGAVEAIGLSADLLNALKAAALPKDRWRKVFSVYLGETIPEDPTARPPMLGDYRIVDGALSFQPRFPFLEGRRHTAQLDIDELYALAGLRTDGRANALELAFAPPPPAKREPSRVAAIYPSSAELPVNALRFYIHFSQPMAAGQVYQRIRLYDDSGDQVSAPFVELDRELWDPDRKRLTLMFHPGRIKRGLVPHREQGLALAKGSRYRLVIPGDMRDVYGSALAAPFTKTFVAVEADRRSPEPDTWAIRVPNAGSRAPLVVVFDEPLDHGQLWRGLRVLDAVGVALAGQIDVADEETLWRFTPDQAWVPGRYALQVEPWLEDLAGNTPTRLFDADMAEERSILRDDEPLKRTFSIPPAGGGDGDHRRLKKGALDKPE